MKHRIISVGLLSASIIALPVAAAEPDIQQQLRAAATKNSKVMWIMHEITDVHGPRLAGSPQSKAADDWMVKTMQSWGLKNVHLESWDFGHEGWANQLTEVSVVAPYQAPVTVRAMPWTPSTKGLVTADAVLLLPPGVHAVVARSLGEDPAAVAAAAQAGTSPPPMPPAAKPEPMPTQADLTAYLDSMKDKVRGKIVLVGPNAEPAPSFITAPYRIADPQWEARFNPPPERAASAGGPIPGGPNIPPPSRAQGNAPDPSRLTANQIETQVDKFLVDNGALVRVYDGGESHGVIRAQNASGYNEVPRVPGIMISNSDYGRIVRVLRDGDAAVTLRVNVQNAFYPEGKTAYNVIGEIPGTDKNGEVVIIGAHFDSWAGGTGATDNGAGATMMVEAARLLQSLGVKPKRTIRVALWGGEEQGILGSEVYVDKHFGSFESPKADFAKLSAAINIDSGTSKVRGAGVFGPLTAARFVAGTMRGFRDWGFVGTNSTNGRSFGSTDSSSFSRAGLPAIGLNQDSFDYFSYTHHSNYDTYEEIYEPDLREASVEVAALAYALASSDEMVPRFNKVDMPPLSGNAPPTRR